MTRAHSPRRPLTATPDQSTAPEPATPHQNKTAAARTDIADVCSAPSKTSTRNAAATHATPIPADTNIRSCSTPRIFMPHPLTGPVGAAPIGSGLPNSDFHDVLPSLPTPHILKIQRHKPRRGRPTYPSFQWGSATSRKQARPA